MSDNREAKNSTLRCNTSRVRNIYKIQMKRSLELTRSVKGCVQAPSDSIPGGGPHSFSRKGVRRTYQVCQVKWTSIPRISRSDITADNDLKNWTTCIYTFPEESRVKI